jgi:DNA-directed DNA polymerase III PolC
MMFIPLRVHSQWSLLGGVPALDDIAQRAASDHLPAVALTDVHALYGALDFVQKCRAARVQPLLGVDFAFQSEHVLTLLAQNLTGYANLCRLVTLLQGASDREERLARGLTPDNLIDHTTGLIALADEATTPQVIDLFGRERLYLRLDRPTREAAAVAQRANVSLVAAPDIRYLAAEEAAVYRALTAMRLGQLVQQLPALPDHAWPSSIDLSRRYAEFPQAIPATFAIAEQCAFEFPLGQYRFPQLHLPDDRLPGEEIRAQAYAGAARRYGEMTLAVEERLRKEIHVIDTLGYGPYFLVVADIVRFARERGVPISPRGSASSSVVAYCLGIHDVDPLAHNLYFERFLSLERRDPPDIDLDLCSRRRDEVIDYVYRRYGAEHVAMVCTYATLQPRSALREVAKAYGLPEKRSGELAEQLPRFWHPGMRQASRDAQAQLFDRARDPIEAEIIAMSQRVTGFPHHLSIHPGGIVIAPEPITRLVPLQHATKGLLITQFDLKGVEQLGLVKIDLLGISALTVLADCVALVQERAPDFRLEGIPLDDTSAQQTLEAAQTIGCFQIESAGMRFTLRELGARTIDDVLITLALYRPGPLQGGLKDAFVRRHSGQEAADYLHPVLEPILRETYGVILYQEQVLRIAHEVGGFSLGEADALRRAMSKRSAQEMARWRERFIAGAQHTGGMDETTAAAVWHLMEVFAGYGFPKAHAAGYAALAYRLTYLKTHYPAEFMAARLAVWGGYYSPRVYMSEARRLGLTVKPPHINFSEEAFTLDRRDRATLWMGLGQVRELTQTTIGSIRQARPFDSLDDFLLRAQPQHSEVVNLVKCGALSGLGEPAALLAVLEAEPWRGRHAAQLRLRLSVPVKPPPATLLQQAAWEQEILGYPAAIHPLDLHRDQLLRAGAISSVAIPQYFDRTVALGGLRVAQHRVKGESGGTMLLVDLEDQHGLYQALWSGTALQQYRELITQRGSVLVRGRVRRDRHGRAVVVGGSVEAL